MGLLTGNTVNSCVPRDTMSWWQDGTSNQLVVGEKHIPINRLNVCRLDRWNQGDCSFLTGNDSNQSVGRNMFRDHRLARSPNDYDRDHNDDSTVTGYGFGSYHPGICQFLFGDGAVRSISNATPLNTILCPLAEVNDGQTVPGF